MNNDFNIFEKPSSLKDYVKIRELYISKRMIFGIIVSLISLLFFIIQFVIPYLEGKLWIPTIVINTPKYHTYKGVAKVVSEEGDVIYKGNLDVGTVTGYGELFEQDGKLYDGNFSENKFSGSGKLYYATNGNIKYNGIFEDNNYKEGKLYYENGKPLYEGSFESGLFKNGRLYYENGSLKYEGTFESGQYIEGALYFENGGLRYTGAFLNGMYNGMGKEYRDGQLIYEGSFKDNYYDGRGKLYNKGSILYDGEFQSGVYSGYGELYYDGGRKKYAGDFLDGLYSGHGVLYNLNGREIYKGLFYMGEADFVYFINESVDNVRESFGKERRLMMFENSFMLDYNEMNVFFEFSFADEENYPEAQKIKFLGAQRLLGVENGISVEEFKELFETDAFTEYFFTLNDEDEVSFSGANSSLREGDSAYCVKFNLESIYIRAFFEDDEGCALYYEIGGI